MKILQVIPYFVPAWDKGGPLNATYNLSRALVKRGHDVTVYTTDVLNKKGRVKNKTEVIDGIKIIRFSNLSNYIAYNHNVYLSPGMASYVRRTLQDFDIIHLHENRTLQNIIIHHYAQKYGVPYIVQAHGGLPRIMSKARLKQLYDVIWGQNILHDAARVIALTNIEAEQYQKEGVDEKHIELIPNGIDLSEFSDLPSKGSFRKKHGISENTKIILFLARIHKIKGPDLLIRAFNQVLKNIPDAKLIIVGPDDGYLTTINNLINELKIEGYILFTGALYGRDKLEAYVDSDVYVLPSRYETFPNTVLEAMACGTPVIVTDRCGIANIFDGQAGLVVLYDENALGKAILAILSEGNKIKEFVIRGKLLVHDKLNWTQIGEQIELLYSNIIISKV